MPPVPPGWHVAARRGRCRAGCPVRRDVRQVGQVIEQALEVAVGLGGHGAGDALVELGLVEAAVAVVPGKEVRDRGPVGVGDAVVPEEKCRRASSSRGTVSRSP